MFGYITTASTSTIVQTVSRCMVARSCAIGTASTVVRQPAVEHVPGQPLDAGRRRPLADPDGDHAGREQQDVAALDRLVLRAVAPARCRRTAGGAGRSPGSACVSRLRAGMARLVTATWSRIQTLESRVNSRLGSGSMTKSCRSMNR